MYLPKAVFLVVLLALTNARSVKDVPVSHGYIDDTGNIFIDDVEDVNSEQPFEYVYPVYKLRIRRQVHGAVNTNPDGSTNVLVKIPLIGNSDNMLSATGSIIGNKPGGSFSSVGAGLSLDNVNGHGLSISGKHIPNFGDQLTAAGKVNLLNTANHKLDANAFTTRNKPTIPNLPNFSTHGGSLDYMYNNKVGASLSVANTPLFQKTDISTMGNLNIFRDRSSSLDFSAGATKTFSPLIPRSSWEPRAGLSFTKYF